MSLIRVMLVDDEAIVRDGLRSCIDWEANGKAGTKTLLKVCEILWRFIRSNDNLLARFI